MAKPLKTVSTFTVSNLIYILAHQGMSSAETEETHAKLEAFFWASCMGKSLANRAWSVTSKSYTAI